ncbi:MAG: hypothetical protein KC478_00380 [Bacteriovoracaceae bacterium]|nr:hypothetical protein [Bacteriovoracaceae bacterium]
MFKNTKKICLAAATVLTLGVGANASATCTNEVYDHTGRYFKGNTDGMMMSGGLFLTGGAITATAGGGFVPLGVGLSSTSVAGFDQFLADSAELDASESYAYSILWNVEKNHTTKIEVLSFIKLVKREIGKDRNAVLPTDQEILDAIKTLSADLSLCYDEQGDFKVPNKESLKTKIVNYLTY